MFQHGGSQQCLSCSSISCSLWQTKEDMYGEQSQPSRYLKYSFWSQIRRILWEMLKYSFVFCSQKWLGCEPLSCIRSLDIYSISDIWNLNTKARHAWLAHYGGKQQCRVRCKVLSVILCSQPHEPLEMCTQVGQLWSVGCEQMRLFSALVLIIQRYF